MPFAAPSLILASASLSQASYWRRRGIAAATVERAGGRAQHQRLDLRRMGDGVVQHGPAAHRLADEAHVGELQMIDQRGEIAGIVGGIGPAGDGIRRREAAMGEGHAGVVWCEVRDLLPPAQVIAAQPMGEQQGGSAARHFVVEIAERPLQPADRARRHRIKRHGNGSPLQEDQRRAHDAQRPASRGKQTKLAFEGRSGLFGQSCQRQLDRPPVRRRRPCAPQRCRLCRARGRPSRW